MLFWGHQNDSIALNRVNALSAYCIVLLAIASTPNLNWLTWEDVQRMKPRCHGAESGVDLCIQHAADCEVPEVDQICKMATYLTAGKIIMLVVRVDLGCSIPLFMDMFGICSVCYAHRNCNTTS